MIQTELICQSHINITYYRLIKTKSNHSSKNIKANRLVTQWTWKAFYYSFVHLYRVVYHWTQVSIPQNLPICLLDWNKEQYLHYRGRHSSTLFPRWCRYLMIILLYLRKIYQDFRHLTQFSNTVDSSVFTWATESLPSGEPVFFFSTFVYNNFANCTKHK